ncbi:MAG: hypothetical protein LBG95_03750, partial [Treponema sp.]|nr:hypothetical protein [Treponema sp.]
MGIIQGDLFAENEESLFSHFDDADIALIAALHSPAGLNLSGLPSHARLLYELSANAFDSIVYARMSELPISAEINRYEHKILAAAQAAAAAQGDADAAARRKAAEAAAVDRGDPDVCAVTEAAQ